MNQQIGQIVVVALVVLALGFRIWRASRATRLRIERMWVVPLIIVVAIGLLMYSQPPPATLASYVALGVAGALGLVVGWYRGRLVRISINPETHALTSQQSPWGMIVVLLVLGLRYGVRFALQDQHDFMGFPVAIIVDAVTVLFAANIICFALERWLRARKLLADAIAAKAAGKAVPSEVTQAHAGDRTEAGHG